MWLVLCERGDAVASWVADGLLDRGMVPVETVTPERLAYARRWEHRITPEGVSTEVCLADGRRIRSGEVRGVLNRLAGPFGPQVGLATAADQEYARHEMTALVASWLQGLACPVLNRPPGHSVSGPWLHASEWRALALRAGLPTAPYRREGRDAPDEDPWGPIPEGGRLGTVFVVGDDVAGAAPALVQGCRHLAQLAAADLLGLTFAISGADAWAFLGATPLPDLREGGPRLLDLLGVALGGGA